MGVSEESQVQVAINSFTPFDFASCLFAPDKPDSETRRVFSAAQTFCYSWDLEWNVTSWLGSVEKDLGDPHTTTDSWASLDCSVSGAGPAVAPDRLPVGVMHSVTAKKFTFQQFQPRIQQLIPFAEW